MRKELQKLEYDTDEFHKINDIINTLLEYKNKGANFIDFTGYSNVIKIRFMDISDDDDLVIDEYDIVD